jgi:hypothetical protein
MTHTPDFHLSQAVLDSSGAAVLASRVRIALATRPSQKNRETKEEPTILLITKDRLWEPTMFMKINEIASIGHDVTDNKWLA